MFTTQLSEEQQMIRDMARDFAKNEIAPNAEQWEKDGWLGDAAIAQMGELGLLGMTVPDTEGGSFIDYVSYALAVEEIAAADAAMSTMMSVHSSVCCGTLLKAGNEAQKQKWLADMCSGKVIGSFCLTEPQAGSDASALKCRATFENGEWVLNGAKQFVTNGKRAGVAIVFAVTDPELGKKGISAFLVPTDNPGYIVSRVEHKLGIKASDTCAITLENCRIPEENLLGERGKGLAIALANLENGRVGIAAQAVGIARAAFESALKYANERTQFGKPLAQHQSITNMLAEMHTQIEAARLLVLNAASLKDRGIPSLSQASQAKLFASEMCERVCSMAIQIHGGYGFLEDYAVQRYYRDARITQIYEGTSEVQKIVIARALQDYQL